MEGAPPGPSPSGATLGRAVISAGPGPLFAVLRRHLPAGCEAIRRRDLDPTGGRSWAPAVAPVRSEDVARVVGEGCRRPGVRRRQRATLHRTFQAIWVKAVEHAGLPKGFRFHDLRHTGNTWAAGSGANLRELMERMGHSSERAALIYLHAASEGHRRIADGIDRKLSGNEKADDDDDGSSGVPAKL